MGTVKCHLANIFQKMDVGSRGEEAAREALVRDWITIEDVRGPELGEDERPGPS